MAGLYQDHFRMFALYNRWANTQLYKAAAQLPAEALAEDRGAFFKSVLGTLNHLLVADRMWLARLQGAPAGTRLDELLFATLPALAKAREAEDARLIAYIGGLEEARFGEDATYHNTTGAPFTQVRHQILAHLFNHQTHHRGQAHDLLCQIGGRDAVPVLDLVAYQRHVMPLDLA